MRAAVLTPGSTRLRAATSNSSLTIDEFSLQAERRVRKVPGVSSPLRMARRHPDQDSDRRACRAPLQDSASVWRRGHNSVAVNSFDLVEGTRLERIIVEARAARSLFEIKDKWCGSASEVGREMCTRLPSTHVHAMWRSPRPRRDRRSRLCCTRDPSVFGA